jgi:hypothetical protein
MTEEKLKEFEKFCEEENLDLKKFENLVSDYLYTNKEPTNTEIEKVCLD